MKKLIVWASIIVLTFIIGITATFFWFKANPKIESYEDAFTKEIPKVEFCELVKNPDKYNGKVILIKSKLNWNMHGFYLEDFDCGINGDLGLISVSHYKPNKKQIDEILQPLQLTGINRKPTFIVAVGRFIYKREIGQSDQMIDRTHLNFEIYKIEFISYME